MILTYGKVIVKEGLIRVFENIITNPLDQVLVQKFAAYVKRSVTQPREIYDIVWLYSHGARLDESFMK